MRYLSHRDDCGRGLREKVLYVGRVNQNVATLLVYCGILLINKNTRYSLTKATALCVPFLIINNTIKKNYIINK